MPKNTTYRPGQDSNSLGVQSTAPTFIMKRKKKTTKITTEWNEVNERKTKNEKKLFASSSVCGQLKHLVDCQLDWFLTHDTDQLTLS